MQGYPSPPAPLHVQASDDGLDRLGVEPPALKKRPGFLRRQAGDELRRPGRFPGRARRPPLRRLALCSPSPVEARFDRSVPPPSLRERDRAAAGEPPVVDEPCLGERAEGGLLGVRADATALATARAAAARTSAGRAACAPRSRGRARASNSLARDRTSGRSSTTPALSAAARRRPRPGPCATPRRRARRPHGRARPAKRGDPRRLRPRPRPARPPRPPRPRRPPSTACSRRR